MFTEELKARLAQAIAGAVGQVRVEIQQRQLCPFFRADPDYGGLLAGALNIQWSVNLIHSGDAKRRPARK